MTLRVPRWMSLGISWGDRLQLKRALLRDEIPRSVLVMISSREEPRSRRRALAGRALDDRAE